MKRFTDPEKWTKDRWFGDLEPKYKYLWLCLVDLCDAVGVWEVNFRMVSFLTGTNYKEKDALEALGAKIHVFAGGAKWWIRGFIRFQYKELTEDAKSAPIRSYVNQLKRHGLWDAYTKGVSAFDEEKYEAEHQEKTADGDDTPSPPPPKPTPVPSSSGYTDVFERFWACYPKRVGKAAASKSFNTAIKNGADIDALIAAVEKQKKSDQWKRDNGQYIPNPATWLNQGRWEDDVLVAGQSPDKPSTHGTHPPHIVYEDLHRNVSDDNFEKWHLMNKPSFARILRVDAADMEDRAFSSKYHVTKQTAMELVNACGY